MDKDFMLIMIRDRLKYLHAAYTKACAGKDIKGNDISYSKARAIRYYSKKDSNILKLLELLLMSSSINSIDDDEMQDAFNKLVEPRILRNK